MCDERQLPGDGGGGRGGRQVDQLTHCTMGGCLGSLRPSRDLTGSTFSHYSLDSGSDQLDLYPGFRYVETEGASLCGEAGGPERGVGGRGGARALAALLCTAAHQLGEFAGGEAGGGGAGSGRSG